MVYPQTQQWIQPGCFEAMAHDRRAVLRRGESRADALLAAILDSRPRQSTPERGVHARHEGATRRKGSKVRLAVDTLGHLPAAHVTAAHEQDRAQVAAMADAVREAVEVAFVNRGDTGPALATAARGMRLPAVKLPETKRGLVLSPQRWAVERSFAWAARCRQLACDDERSVKAVEGPHFRLSRA